MQKAKSVYIEISGRCNAKCPYCARQRFKQRYSGKDMSPELFEKIIDHLSDIEVIDETSRIGLYNWGEPFLNKDINVILGILKEKNIKCYISSNFIKYPEIEDDKLSVLSSVTFSLSGFTQESYGKIHGAPLVKVLENFDRFYAKLRNYAPDTSILLVWHRYRFNESELWKAFKYFQRPAISFCPTIAYFNDMLEMIDYVEGSISKDRYSKAKNDIFFDQIDESIVLAKNNNTNSKCSQWDHLTIDEYGSLLLCCGVTTFDNNLGSVLELSADEIWKRKKSELLCNKCKAFGLPFIASILANKPLPSYPPGLEGLWYQFHSPNSSLMISRGAITRAIKNIPYGETIVGYIKKKLAN
jgi:MoaA/NifB/PqqE/SkfB family radical SAM enzyme